MSLKSRLGGRAAGRDARRRKTNARHRSRQAHNYRSCRDTDCERTACEAYREGFADGMDAARED